MSTNTNIIVKNTRSLIGAAMRLAAGNRKNLLRLNQYNFNQFLIKITNQGDKSYSMNAAT